MSSWTRILTPITETVVRAWCGMVLLIMWLVHAHCIKSILNFDIFAQVTGTSREQDIFISGCSRLIARGAASRAPAFGSRGGLEQLVETSHNHHETQRRLERHRALCRQNTTQIRREPREVSAMWLECEKRMNQKLHCSASHGKK